MKEIGIRPPRRQRRLPDAAGSMHAPLAPNLPDRTVTIAPVETVRLTGIAHGPTGEAGCTSLRQGSSGPSRPLVGPCR
ncbi:hypothetical protein, partial [Paralimibaculum aggregatum]|uniref:hypothetical protein n=1 Tax=Paralimibaculum aggregatum TaxID=3036245 RepID=UPI002554EA29